MSTPSLQNDDQPAREYLRHEFNKNISTPTQLQHQPHLPSQQSFLNTNNNIALQQHSAVLQQQTTLALPPGGQGAAQHPTSPSALQAPPPSQFVHWSNPLIGSPSFVQAQQQPTQSPDVQHQQFNDFFFNIQAQAAYAASVPPTQVPSTSTQQETYAVLRVGKGNFLKIYHCPENAMNNMPGEPPFNTIPQYNHNHTTSFHHASPQGKATFPALHQHRPQSQVSGNTNSATPQVFNSYELFSSSTFTQLPTGDMPPLFLLGPTAKPPIIMTEDIHSMDQASSRENTNLIIHNMPINTNDNNSNWTGGNHVGTSTLYAQDSPVQKDILTHTFTNLEDVIPITNVNDVTLDNDNAYISLQQHQKHQTHSQQSPSVLKDNEKQNFRTTAACASILATPSLKTEILRQEAPKKRIVAEVKPMRMTYSDVLSKLNNQTQNSPQNNSNYPSMKMGTACTPAVSNHRSQQKQLKIDCNNANNLRRICDDAPVMRSSSKKSPTHENKENQLQQQQQTINNKFNNNPKRSTVTVINSTNITNTFNNSNNICPTINKSSTTMQKNLINNSKNSNSNNSNCNANNNDNQQSKKQRSNKNSESQNVGGKNYSSTEARGASKTNIGNSASNSTLSANTYNSSNNTFGRKTAKLSNFGNSSSATGQQRSRYQNNLNTSYSYSSAKRGRNGSSYGASSSLNNTSYANSTGSNRNYELVKCLLRAWYRYTLKVLTWLFYLVYDIIVLGCSILYERFMYTYDNGKTYAKQLHNDLKQNSNKPGIWFKRYCRQFDARFSKTSKWAFWRRFFKKKIPEPTSESIKTGKLPATGDEAMYQLLNCKGKDAYSILGVPPNSSQEQIRKHYKKLAVLVHPDKNKQAGAEEAFKVLQRAFELIGEPENRLAYDQSLAEALHAEKAWTELHDLLSQLQTKIAEAANTIRCSTCGLRHPRKLTGRPHYAARECASCKIRHSAREGDIWAETSMLGLRWKYLALMEGKVFDITEWANCQKGALAHLEPNSHMVQYRIVRGAQQQQQQKQPSQQQQQHSGSQYAGTGGLGSKFKRDSVPPSEASLHEFLDNLYSGQHPQQNNSAYAGSSRRRNRRN